jgi:hypothetical protein
MEWGMVIMGYVQVRLKYPDVSQPAHKTDSSDESVKNVHIVPVPEYKIISGNYTQYRYGTVQYWTDAIQKLHCVISRAIRDDNKLYCVKICSFVPITGIYITVETPHRIQNAVQYSTSSYNVTSIWYRYQCNSMLPYIAIYITAVVYQYQYQ